MKDKAMNFEEIWSQVVETIKNGKVPMRVIRTYLGSWIEVRLTALGLAIWPQADYDDLKGRNRILARVLREHGSFIRKSSGIRWIYIPIDSIPSDQKKKSLFKKMKKIAERRKTIKEEVLVAEVWPW